MAWHHPRKRSRHRKGLEGHGRAGGGDGGEPPRVHHAAWQQGQGCPSQREAHGEGLCSYEAHGTRQPAGSRLLPSRPAEACRQPSLRQMVAHRRRCRAAPARLRGRTPAREKVPASGLGAAPPLNHGQGPREAPLPALLRPVCPRGVPGSRYGQGTPLPKPQLRHSTGPAARGHAGGSAPVFQGARRPAPPAVPRARRRRPSRTRACSKARSTRWAWTAS